MSDLEYGYRFDEARNCHIWFAKNEHGGIHVSATEAPEESNLWDNKYFGGIEVHSPKRRYEFAQDDTPSHEKCWLLDGPCWHDGSSLYFSENIAPMLDHGIDQSVTDYINSIMMRWHRENFGTEATS